MELFEKYRHREVDAPINLKLAPVASRRDIAGAIHRVVLGEGPPQLRAFSRLNHRFCCAAVDIIHTVSNLNVISEASRWTRSRDLSWACAACTTCFPLASSAARVCDRSKVRCSSFCARKPSLRCRFGRSCCCIICRFGNIHSGQLGSALIMIAEPPCVQSVHYPSRIAEIVF